MVLDPEVDARLPGALDRQGQRAHRATAASCTARVDEPKGDPGNTLSRAELEDKAMRLAAYQRRRQRSRDARRSCSACGRSPTRRASTRLLG